MRFARTAVVGQERVAFYAIWGLVGVIVALHGLRTRTINTGWIGVGLVIGAAAQLAVIVARGGSPTVYSLGTSAAMVGIAAWVVGSTRGASSITRGTRLFERISKDPPWCPTNAQLRTAAYIGFIAAAVGTFVLVSGAPLGHDESVYALKARAWLEGTPATGFGLHRPVGMPAVAAVILWISDSTTALRLGAAITALLSLFALWRLSLIGGRSTAGMLTVVSFAASQPYLRRAPEFLNDLVTSGLMIGVIIVVWSHFEGRYRALPLWVASALTTVAFYLRYGSALIFIVIAIVSAATFRRRLKQHVRAISVATALLFVGIAPHLVYAQKTTGSILGILAKSSEIAGRAYLGDGLVRYAYWFPAKLAGTMLAVVMLIGVISVVRRWHTRTPTDRFDRYITLIALLSATAVGLTIHGEQRYVFFNVLLLGLVGWSAVLTIARQWPDTTRRVATWGLTLTLAFSLGSGVFEARLRSDLMADHRAVLEAVGDTIAGDRPCTVVTSYSPQLTWMSGCAAVSFATATLSSFRPQPGEPTYLATFENGKRQPGEKDLAALLERFRVVTVEPIESLTDRIGDAVVYQIEDKQ
ncbi:hypothetical protein MNBD_ACTINO02-1787 [hydrothermal vent metagenome]|uniref:Glycosyltransferase RgtA/B/C/D-like domain-containing protein n=1 Tax=hydrothermal vent metagenome TaxID=652676 RepID=A0A3B0THI4_9ZZZZ